MNINLSKLDTKPEVERKVHRITTELRRRFYFNHLELEGWTNETITYFTEDWYKDTLTIEVELETLDIYAKPEDQEQWIHLGKLVHLN